MGKGLYASTLGAALVVFWLMLSGKWDNALLLSLGAVSVVLVVILVERMGILDAETSPFHRIFPLLRYWRWLGGEVVRANIAVTKVVVRADMDITPRLARFQADQTTEFGLTVFANSVTLTPGTVTVDVDGRDLMIHTLTDTMADPAGFAEMGARAGRAAEGRAS